MKRAATAGIVVAVAVAAVVLASPLFYEREVDEPLPLATDGMMTLDEFFEMDEAERDRAAEKMSDEAKNAIMAESAGTVSQVSDGMEGMDGAVEVTRTGEFKGLDGHSASGTAKIISVGDESYLRFEDFTVTNGPDLKVYLTPTGSVEDGRLLADLKGSRGSQNYILDAADAEIAGFVVIYCQPFHVYFAHAELTG